MEGIGQGTARRALDCDSRDARNATEHGVRKRVTASSCIIDREREVGRAGRSVFVVDSRGIREYENEKNRIPRTACAGRVVTYLNRGRAAYKNQRI